MSVSLRGVRMICASGLALAALAGVSATMGCQSGPGVTKAPAQPTFSNVKEVAAKLVTDCLGRPWRDDFAKGNTRLPVVAVLGITNKSDVVIERELIVNPVLRELVNSRKVQVLSEDDVRQKTRVALNDDEFRDPAYLKNLKAQAGADYLLTGSIVSMRVGAEAGYQFTLKLVNTETALEEWIGLEDLEYKAR